MTREEAIGWLQRWQSTLRGDGSPLELAILKAIEALEQPEQKKGKWIPIKTRPMDEGERKEWSEKLGCELEDDEAVIYMSLPDDGQEVLTCSRYGHIAIDKFENDPDYGCCFEENGDMDGIVAWMPLPEPWGGEECQLKDDTSHPFADDVLMGGD